MINPKLVIVCPDAIASYWRTTSIADLFQSNNLVLRVRDGDYARRTVGSGVQAKEGFRSVYATAETKVSGFQVKIRDTREDLWLMLKDLAEYCAGDGFEIIPLTIYDYCLRENRTDRERGYRLRVGYIPGDGLEDIGGSATSGYVACNDSVQPVAYTDVVAQPVQHYGNGFSFKFMEIDRTGFY